MNATDITDSDVIEAMQRFGGSFAKQLAECYCVADELNRRRIRTVWQDEFREYREIVLLKHGGGR